METTVTGKLFIRREAFGGLVDGLPNGVKLEWRSPGDVGDLTYNPLVPIGDEEYDSELPDLEPVTPGN